LACGSAALHAHDIAVFPSTDGGGVRLLVRFGHPGDYQPALPAKLVTLDAIAPNGARRGLAGRLRPDGITLVAPPVTDLVGTGTWIFTAYYDNGFFLRTADGRSVNTTRADYPTTEPVTHNLKFGKALHVVGTAGPGFDRVAGHRLELVPKQDPFAVPPGRALEVLALFDGKPLAKEAVFLYGEQDDAPTTQLSTDAAGIVRVPIDRAGRFLIGTEHDVPSRHPELATRDAYAATLVFTRP